VKVKNRSVAANSRRRAADQHEHQQWQGQNQKRNPTRKAGNNGQCGVGVFGTSGVAKNCRGEYP